MPLNIQPRGPRFSLRSALLVAALMLGPLAAPGAAQADDPLGLYIGAAYGQAHIRAQLQGLTLSGSSITGGFDANHTAYQGMLGIRPISFLGAEITYMDFGQSSVGNPSFFNPLLLPPTPYPSAVQISQKGEAAYALLYLPVPVIDVYVKAGMSRITTDMRATYIMPGAGTCTINNPNCAIEVVRRSPTDTAFAYGAGVQWKLGDWAVRGEYERFSAAGANPSLISIGMTYWLPLL
jgi:Outer membrane protein beta-barrel domain